MNVSEVILPSERRTLCYRSFLLTSLKPRFCHVFKETVNECLLKNVHPFFFVVLHDVVHLQKVRQLVTGVGHTTCCSLSDEIYNSIYVSSYEAARLLFLFFHSLLFASLVATHYDLSRSHFSSYSSCVIARCDVLTCFSPSYSLVAQKK